MGIEIARIRELKSGMSNGGWFHDTHPYLKNLDAGATIEIANVKGPAVIKAIFSGKHEMITTDQERIESMPRGIVLLIYYNDSKEPAVQVPLADFFGDGCNGRTEHFGNIFVEHTPEAYIAYFPMPFEKSCRVYLRNDTPYDTLNYSFVEYEELENWDDSLGYFHATYRRISFQSTPKTVQKVFEVSGRSGHIIGQQLSISTDEPGFGGFWWLMEANNEIRIDTDEPSGTGPYSKGKGPDYDYLGTECAFGMGWGWKRYLGHRVGCPYYRTIESQKVVQAVLSGDPQKGLDEIKAEDPLSQLSVYRFYNPDTIRFSQSIDWRLNWTHEFIRNPWGHKYRKWLDSLAEQDRLFVDYAYVTYWYQDAVGYQHEPLPPYQQRFPEVVRSNKR